MSQLSARSAVFLDEMGVGPQWRLRHPAPESPEVPNELTEAPVPAQAVAPAPQVHAPVAADAPGPMVAPQPATAPALVMASVLLDVLRELAG